MCTRRNFRVFKEGWFFFFFPPYLRLVMFSHNGMEARKSTDGDAVVFMVLKFLCHFLLFGMCMLLWILLDAK
jgi:hypothetical protein